MMKLFPTLLSIPTCGATPGVHIHHLLRQDRHPHHQQHVGRAARRAGPQGHAPFLCRGGHFLRPLGQGLVLVNLSRFFHCNPNITHGISHKVLTSNRKAYECKALPAGGDIVGLPAKLDTCITTLSQVCVLCNEAVIELKVRRCRLTQ